MPLSKKLWITAILIGCGFFASSVLTLPARHVSWLGLSFELTGRTVMGLVLMALACTAAEFTVRDFITAGSQLASPSISYWILPAALTLAAWFLLARLTTIPSKAIGAAVSGVALAVLLAAEGQSLRSSERMRTPLLVTLDLVAYLLAMLLFVAIDVRLARGLSAVAFIAVVSTLLAVRLMCYVGCPWIRVGSHAIVAGLSMGAFSWLLSAWIQEPLARSCALVVLLYMLTGVTRNRLLGRLTPRVVGEYVLVGLVAFLLLAFWVR